MWMKKEQEEEEVYEETFLFTRESMLIIIEDVYIQERVNVSFSDF